MKGKRLVLLVIISVFILSIAIWKVSEVTKEKALQKKIGEIQLVVNAFYSNNNKDELSMEVNEQLLTEAQVLINEFEDKKLSDKIKDDFNSIVYDFELAMLMYQLRESVDNLFNENGAIKEGIDINSSRTLYDRLIINDTPFAQVQLEKINNAEEQLRNIEIATNKVTLLFTSDLKQEVKGDISRILTQEAKDAVSAVNNQSVKADLLSFIQVADDYLSDKEAKEAAARVANSNNVSTNTQTNLTGWQRYSAGDIATLLRAISNGYVVYYNGSYWASPKYIDMIKNEEIVYERDIADE